MMADGTSAPGQGVDLPSYILNARPVLVRDCLATRLPCACMLNLPNTARAQTPRSPITAASAVYTPEGSDTSIHGRDRVEPDTSVSSVPPLVLCNIKWIRQDRLEKQEVGNTNPKQEGTRASATRTRDQFLTENITLSPHASTNRFHKRVTFRLDFVGTEKRTALKNELSFCEENFNNFENSRVTPSLGVVSSGVRPPGQSCSHQSGRRLLIQSGAPCEQLPGSSSGFSGVSTPGSKVSRPGFSGVSTPGIKVGRPGVGGRSTPESKVERAGAEETSPLIITIVLSPRAMVRTFYEGVSAKATALLHEAIRAERSRKWTEASDHYSAIETLISEKHLPMDFIPPPGYPLTMYEIHAHMGWALQKCGQDKKAVVAYSKAIQRMYQQKKTCEGGCFFESNFNMPVHAKRALALARLKYKTKAYWDVDTSVAYDRENPDIYCVRALVLSTFQDHSKAVSDVKSALALNREHKGALLLKDALEQYQIGNRSASASLRTLSPESEGKLRLLNLLDSNALSFVDKYLYSLNIPHTGSQISIIPFGSVNALKMYGGSSKEKSALEMQLNSAAASSYYSSSQSTGSNGSSSSRKTTFRCGYPGDRMQEFVAIEKQRRRQNYSEAVKTYLTDSATVSDAQYINSIKKKHRQQEYMEWKRRKTPDNNQRHQPQVPMVVFQKVNLTEDLPRLYTRPWNGDKLRPALVKEHQKKPIFL